MSPTWHLGAARAPEPEAWGYHAEPSPRLLELRRARFRRTAGTPGPKPVKAMALVAELARHPDRTCGQLAASLAEPSSSTNLRLIELRDRGLVISYGRRPFRWILGPVDKLVDAGMLAPQAAPSPGGDGEPPACAKPQTTPEPISSPPA